VSSANKIHIMLLKETRDNIRTERERNTSIVFAPSSNVLIGIRPQKITEKTAVRNISRAHNPADLLHRVEIRAQTTVHGENLLVDDSSDRKAVEAVGESLPQLDVIATLALVVESINTVDRGALVVASKDEEVFGVLDLVGEEQADSLKRLLSSVDVITKEEVVGLGREATVLEESEKIVVLSVNITTDLNGSLKLEEDRLRNEDLASFSAEVADLSLKKLNLLARPAASHLE
jgi:hypothetical protein